MKRPLLAITATWMVAVAYAAFIGSTLVDGYRTAARDDVPLYTDFTPTYAASMLEREIPPAVPFLAAIRTIIRGPAALPFALFAGLIGLASVKPHLGILIPLALIAGGYWRAFAAAPLTVTASRHRWRCP